MNVTFGLALLGYALLGLDMAQRMHGRRPRWLTLLTALVVLAHVAMVWHFRFGWSVTKAFEGHEGGFFMFHGALAMIVAAPWVSPPTTLRLVGLAFAVVSLGAITATFKYDVVQDLRLPVIGVCLASVVGSAWPKRKARG